MSIKATFSIHRSNAIESLKTEGIFLPDNPSVDAVLSELLDLVFDHENSTENYEVVPDETDLENERFVKVYITKSDFWRD